MSEAERERLARAKAQALSGTPGDVAQRLRALAREMQVDEVAITSTAFDPVARQKSYQLLAAAFGLNETRIAA
jgi:alkanesulfonate monooxygenase SsuD/methylene tetrahydromethanopterin reductase-like flavin-dependent oxidoreductase (luciferase family)